MLYADILPVFYEKISDEEIAPARKVTECEKEPTLSSTNSEWCWHSSTCTKFMWPKSIQVFPLVSVLTCLTFVHDEGFHTGGQIDKVNSEEYQEFAAAVVIPLGAILNFTTLPRTPTSGLLTTLSSRISLHSNRSPSKFSSSETEGTCSQ